MLTGMTFDLKPAALPLHRDAGGMIRVGVTRVTLESVLNAYLEGESAEGIVERFPTLDLADVHATIAWFLRNRAEAELHLAQSRGEQSEGAAEASRRSPAARLRARLLARRGQ